MPERAPLLKPISRRIEKGRRDRLEGQITRIVRAHDVERDGYCRLRGVKIFGDCKGPSEWMHLPGFRRSETKGKPPIERHTVGGTAMGCKKHHDLLDGRRLVDGRRMNCEALSPDGAEGSLGWSLGEIRYEETR